MGWLYLFLAIAFEVSGTTCMKLSDGFSRWLPSLGVIVFYLVSLALLTWTLKTIDVSVAYAVWAGLGTAIVAAIGVAAFHEPLSLGKTVSLALIIAGVVGLNLAGAGH